MGITSHRKKCAYILICSLIAVAFLYFSSDFLKLDYAQEQTIEFQIYVIPKFNSVNFTIEIPRVNISSPMIENTYYTLTKKSDPAVNQIVIINFHLQSNKTEPLHILVNELEPINIDGQQWSPFHSIYNELAYNNTYNWQIKTNFSTFIAVYTVKGSWLQGLTEIVGFRDAYHYVEGNERINHYTTERTPLLMNFLSVVLSLLLFGTIIRIHPSFRNFSKYYPWLTLIMIGMSIMVFVSWTPAELIINYGSRPWFISYFSHFANNSLILF